MLDDCCNEKIMSSFYSFEMAEDVQYCSYLLEKPFLVCNKQRLILHESLVPESYVPSFSGYMYN